MSSTSKPCKDVNSNICVAEECYAEACIKEIFMAGDNVRLTKAFENIAHELKQTNRILEQIKNKMPSRLRFTNHPYSQESSDGTQSAEDSGRNPYGTGTTFPYT
jgi:hypothetical protein